MTPQAIHYALKRLDSSYKKRCNILRLTTYYALQQKIANYDDQGKAIGYRAESGFAQDMPRTYGYLVKGKRCYGTQDWNAKVEVNSMEPTHHQPV